MRITDAFEVKWNIEIDLIERGKRRRWHHRSHNIVVNTGRQFLAEVITASALGPGTFVRTQDAVVRYIGFGIGGSRQVASAASSPPLTDAPPAGYGPSATTQTDTDPTVAILERPVRVSAAPLWMREVSTPGTFPTALRTTFVTVFSETDISHGSFVSVPLTEIGLYKSSANPALPNGAVGAYPGAGGHLIAYDTFDPVYKTGRFSIEVRWTWRFD
jgi:hypothetical protein